MIVGVAVCCSRCALFVVWLLRVGVRRSMFLFVVWRLMFLVCSVLCGCR